MTKIDFTKDDVQILKNGISLLIASQRRQINTSTSERMRKASEESLADTKAVDAKLHNLELPL